MTLRQAGPAHGCVAVGPGSGLRHQFCGERIDAQARGLRQGAQHVEIGLSRRAEAGVLERRVGRFAVKQRANFRRGQTVVGERNLEDPEIRIGRLFAFDPAAFAADLS